MQNKLMKSHKILKFFHIALVIFWAILLVAGYFAIFYPQASHTTINGWKTLALSKKLIIVMFCVTFIIALLLIYSLTVSFLLHALQKNLLKNTMEPLAEISTIFLISKLCLIYRFCIRPKYLDYLGVK